MAVRDYSKGKIYKIVVDTDEEYKPYVGSTIQGLAERMGGHRSDYKKWKIGKVAKCNSYNLFDQFGVDKCKIILLEEYPCDSRMKLLQKEREWFDKMECCNKIKPFTCKEEKVKQKKEWYDKNKDKIYNYKEDNKEHITEQMKIWRNKNKNEINNYNKVYQQEHKEQIAEKAKETFTCKCGKFLTICKKARHNKTQKHQNYLSSLMYE